MVRLVTQRTVVCWFQEQVFACYLKPTNVGALHSFCVIYSIVIEAFAIIVHSVVNVHA